MAFRHVEALQRLGHDAAVTLRPGRQPPHWFSHSAPIVDIEGPSGPGPDDIIVFPEDTYANLTALAGHPARKVVFCQNHYYACRGVTRIPLERLRGFEGFMACSLTVADWLRNRFPGRKVELVPAFADETVFRPAPKRPAIACAPRKRRDEATYLHDLFRWTFPRRADLPWVTLEDVPEHQVADTLGTSAILLSLSHLEGLGLLPLEAMASDCLVAGFTGHGGKEYATPENGFWAEDPEGVVQALGAAADLYARGGPARDAKISAGRATAAKWSRSAMEEALGAFFAPMMSPAGRG
jgi:hypothetical protein